MPTRYSPAGQWLSASTAAAMSPASPAVSTESLWPVHQSLAAAARAAGGSDAPVLLPGTVNATVELQLVFEEEGGLLDVTDFVEFLARFRDLYNLCYGVAGQFPVEKVLVDRETLIREALLKGTSGTELSALSASDSLAPLAMTRISYSSPLEIWLFGSASALVLALLLGGGEVGLFGVRVKLQHSLGESLQHLRAVFSPNPKRRPKAPASTKPQSKGRRAIARTAEPAKVQAPAPTKKRAKQRGDA